MSARATGGTLMVRFRDLDLPVHYRLDYGDLDWDFCEPLPEGTPPLSEAEESRIYEACVDHSYEGDE